MITRTKFIVALASALSLFGLLGCGQTNHLQTITLTASGSGGLFNVKGEGGTLQLLATGNYSDTKTHDLTNTATYVVTAVGTDSFGGALPAPPQTVTFSRTGLITAVTPFVCTWVNTQTDPAKPPAWALSGSYQVVASFGGITSQPVFVGVASSVGSDPSGLCGP